MIGRTLIASAIESPELVIPAARAVGILPSDFTGQQGKQWAVLVDFHDGGHQLDPVAASTILNMQRGTIDTMIAEIPEAYDPTTHAKLVVAAALDREVKKVSDIKGDSLEEKLMQIQEHIDRIAARRARMINPQIRNPGEWLEQASGWHTFMGIEFLDSRIAFTSRQVHFIAGDPGCGKSTIAIQGAVHNAKHGVPVLYIAAEDDEEEITMSMLAQTGEVSAAEATRLQFDPSARRPERFAAIKDLWDEHFAGIPISIRTTRDGEDEALAIASAAQPKSVIFIDHAFAVVAQGNAGTQREHERFNRFFTKLKVLARRGNHIIIVANQYTKAGRLETVRGVDAQYGGSVILNIGSGIIHLWNPTSDQASSSSGQYQTVMGQIMKIRHRLVADENGHEVNPLGSPFQFCLETRYRRVQSTPTIV